MALASTAQASHGASAAPPVHRGTTLGRYVVLEWLGVGGGGEVVAAYDSTLNRRVALKLLHGSTTGPTYDPSQSDGWQRLVREGRILARFAHPNVVTVHDAGVIDGRPFIAMELVEGLDLSRWLERPERAQTWRETLALLASAGRGLAAAHAAQIIHGDFKPANVLVGGDGRVRVTDFGVASLAEPTTEPAAAPAVHTARGDSLEKARTGSLRGTPAYMAPELFTGAVPNERSDIYSFCVSLFEALWGHRPHHGDDLTELHEAKLTPPRAPSKRGVPRWLATLVIEGLAPAPESRPHSMRALLRRLDRALGPRRRAIIVPATLATALAAGVGGYLVSAEDEACTDSGRHLEGVWDRAREDATRAALTEASATIGADAWRRLEPRLENYARTWVDEHAEACRATHLGEQSQNLLDRRMACLSARLDELRAVGTVLAQADSTVALQAADATAQLGELDRCADAELLLAGVAPPSDPEVAVSTAAVRAQLADAKALEWAGRYDAALAIAERSLEHARSAGYEPLEAEARYRRGSVYEKLGDYHAAERELAEAHWMADGVRHEEVAAAAAMDLVQLLSERLARQQAATEWWRHAEASVKRIGLGTVEEAQLHNSLGMILETEGRHAEARDEYSRATAIAAELFGADDLHVGVGLNNVANAHQRLGELDEAEANHRRSLVLYERALGPNHPQLAGAHNNLGNVLADRRLNREAIAHYERAVELWQPTLGMQHPKLGSALGNLGSSLVNVGELEGGRTHYERALAILERSLGPDHPEVGFIETNLGDLSQRQDRPDEALAHHLRALTLLEGQLGGDHPFVAYPLTGIGWAEVARGRAEQAIPVLERAISIRDSDQLPPSVLAETRFVLSRALWDAGRDRERAHALATQALETYRADQGAGEQRRSIERWLAARS